MAKSATTKPEVKEPKLGARASRRLEDVKKDKGAQKAKTVADKAKAIAVKNSDRTIRLEYVYEAEGVKMPDDARSQYGKSNGSDTGKSSAKTSPRKTTSAKTTPAKKTEAKEAGKTGRGNRPAARAKKTASAARPRSRGKKTESGSARSTTSSKSDKTRELREQQAKDRESVRETIEKTGTPPMADPGMEVGGTTNRPPDKESPTTLA